jgi:hypothetical protein
MFQSRSLSQGALSFSVISNSKKREGGICLRTALYKTRKNLLLGRESYPLTSDESKCLYRNHQFKTTFWIDPNKIIYEFGFEKKGQLIVYDGVGRFDLFVQHVTSVFLRELIVQKIRLEETALYKIMSERKLSRPVILKGKRVKIPLNTQNMMIYFDKCQSLIKSIQARGVELSKYDNIGLAIASDGQIAHYRVGHHRLAIAQALGIKRIPIDIILLSGKFLVERIPRRRLWSSWAMVRAVDDVLRDTVANLGKG